MSSTLRKPHLVSPEEYLALEELTLEKSEYVDGEIFAMTGTTISHNRIAGNLYIALASHLRGKPCEAFFADIKVHAARANAFYYPDLVVRCQPQALPGDTRIIPDPTLIIEVLSSSTETTDRREGDIGWSYLAFTDDEAVEFASLGLSLPMATIYANA